MLRLPQIILLDVFVKKNKAILFQKISEPSLLLLIHGLNSYLARSVKIILQSAKSQGYCC